MYIRNKENEQKLNLNKGKDESNVSSSILKWNALKCNADQITEFVFLIVPNPASWVKKDSGKVLPHSDYWAQLKNKKFSCLISLAFF